MYQIAKARLGELFARIAESGELILPLVTATERRLELDRSITHDMKRLSAEMQAAQAVPKRTPKNGKEE